ncbi:MAG TPA: hypothetical protein VJ203_05960 [Bacteroidales bacterium]|nr:hypothetical protein [Bacteroidales bacterium]
MKKIQNSFKSPELTKLQEVVIDYRTKIYIARGADPGEARNRFISKFGYRISKSTAPLIPSKY